eukprot:c21013_g1_i1.p1 GENE.c21013_g1_i1~~c21013_g1_i1.p1  ORF type:complete len:321 (+),score=83.87 c21013_g1_i1:85-1047(+)
METTNGHENPATDEQLNSSGEKRKASAGDVAEQPAKKRLASTISSAPPPPFRTARASRPLYTPHRAGVTSTIAQQPDDADQDAAEPPRSRVPTSDRAAGIKNKRLFGVLLVGALQQAKQDRDKEIANQQAGTFKQRQLTKKIEVRDEEERRALGDRHRAEVQERKRKQQEQQAEKQRKDAEERERRIQQEKDKETARLHKTLNSHMTHLSNFLLTTTQPSLPFVPAKHTAHTTELIQLAKSQLPSKLHQIPQISSNNNGTESSSPTRHRSDSGKQAGEMGDDGAENDARAGNDNDVVMDTAEVEVFVDDTPTTQGKVAKE